MNKIEFKLICKKCQLAKSTNSQTIISQKPFKTRDTMLKESINFNIANLIDLFILIGYNSIWTIKMRY